MKPVDKNRYGIVHAVPEVEFCDRCGRNGRVLLDLFGSAKWILEWAQSWGFRVPGEEGLREEEIRNRSLGIHFLQSVFVTCRQCSREVTSMNPRKGFMWMAETPEIEKAWMKLKKELP